MVHKSMIRFTKVEAKLAQQCQEACNAAIEKMGGPRKTAELLGVSREAVYRWKQIPPKRVREIAKATGMAPEELRPDVYS